MRCAMPHERLETRDGLKVPFNFVAVVHAKTTLQVAKTSGSEAVWNVTALLDRMAAVATLIKAAPDGPAVNVDKARFEMWRAPTEAFIKKPGTSGVQ